MFVKKVAIDLGTTNVLVHVPKRGIVINEPSVVAISKDDRKVLAVGFEAKDMIGRTPDTIIAERPLKDGVVANYRMTEAMLRYFIKKVHRRRVLVSPRMVIAVPSGITEVERRAVKDSAMRAGAREVHLVEEPLAAAIGVGLPIHEPAGNMIVDIGGGTTEVAVISLSGIVFSKSIRIAGDELDVAIVEYLKKNYNLMIGERTAEDIKMKIGSAYPLEEELSLEVRGRDLVAGLPKMVTIASEEIRDAIAEPVRAIVDLAKIALERTPPELAADLIDRGIVLAGGGSLLKGLDRMISEETGLPVHIADDPVTAVALGTGKILELDSKFLRDVTILTKSEEA